MSDTEPRLPLIDCPKCGRKFRPPTPTGVCFDCDESPEKKRLDAEWDRAEAEYLEQA
jgi:uncharacterized OB-fold protein